MEPRQPLHIELAQIRDTVWFIHGNHDADSDLSWNHVWGSKLADRNIHGRIVELPNGLRIAGLGGVFRESVWYPTPSAARGGEPAFQNQEDHRNSTPKQNRWRDGPHRKHWSTIYPDELNKLADLRADILVTHEAPGYHPSGFEILDTLAQALGAKVSVHGHHHDNIDSSARWKAQGFRSFGVGLRGITAIDFHGNAQIIIKGELDEARRHRIINE